MPSVRIRHRDANRRLVGRGEGVVADTFASISRCRGATLALVNSACTLHIDSRTGLTAPLVELPA